MKYKKGVMVNRLRQRPYFNDIWLKYKSRAFVGRCWGDNNNDHKSAIPGSNAILSDGQGVLVLTDIDEPKIFEIHIFGEVSQELINDVNQAIELFKKEEGFS